MSLESVKCFQLIYTNVEADDSPARQRGAQIWLSSPELTTEQRRVVAKRVDDFKLPRAVKADDTTVARYVYAPMSEDGLVVVARTVQLVVKDKFGRSGRFHAHALVFAVGDFARMANDPFAVIDGWKQFHSTPEDAKQAYPDWKNGELPSLDIAIKPPVEPSGTIPADRLIELAAHLVGDSGKTLVVAELPQTALDGFRTLVRALPPHLRLKAAFDTLSNGEWLAKVFYPLVGSYSKDQLAMWSYRKYVALDLKTWAVKPALEAATANSPVRLLQAAGWTELDDTDKNDAFTVAEALSKGSPNALAEVNGAVRTFLQNGWPGFTGYVQLMVEERLKTDLNPGFAEIPEVAAKYRAYANDLAAKDLSLLSAPIPESVALDPLRRALTRNGATEPSPALLEALDVWRQKIPDRRLRMVLARWRGQDRDFAKIERSFANGEDGEWYPQWIESTLPTLLQNSASSETALEDLLTKTRDIPPKLLRDIRLSLALNPDRPSAENLQFHLAHRGGPGSLADWLASKPQKFGEYAVPILEPYRQYRQPGWFCDDGYIVGVWLVAKNADDARLLRFIGDREGRDLQLVYRLLVPEADPIITPRAKIEVQLDVSKEAAELVRRIADPSKRKDAADALRKHLQKTKSDDEFVAFANENLLSKTSGSWAVQEFEGSFFFGLKINLTINDPSVTCVLEAVAGSLVPQVGETGRPADSVPREQRLTKRFGWLLMRLSKIIATGTLHVEPTAAARS